MFTFEKTYTMSVKSSGIATKPKAPVLTVTAAKGDSGKISVKHIDSASKSGTIKVKATCKDKTVEVVSYTNSGTIAHNASKTFTIDFNKHFVPTDEYIAEREKELKEYDNIWENIHKGSYPELYIYCSHTVQVH